MNLALSLPCGDCVVHSLHASLWWWDEKHSVHWQHCGLLDDHFSSSHAIFPTLAICLGLDLALEMVWLTEGCLSESRLHFTPQQCPSLLMICGSYWVSFWLIFYFVFEEFLCWYLLNVVSIAFLCFLKLQGTLHPSFQQATLINECTLPAPNSTGERGRVFSS